MADRVVFVGGARSQCHAIQILKKLGCYVIVVDYDKNCSGSRIADEFYCVSTTDVEDITKIAKEKNAIAVLAVQSDVGLVTSSIVSLRLGTNGLPHDKVELFTNKYRMRQYLKEKGFLYPAFRKCRNQQEVEDFANENGFPFVMKPLDSQGSRGVEVIHKTEDLKKINHTIAYSKREKAVIVEEYLGNEEYTIEGIVIDGRHYTLAISRKIHYENLECVSKELYYSWEDGYDKLIVQHNKLIDSTGLSFGITHSEYIKTEKGFVLVEFTARGGGSMISSHIVPAVSGWDVEYIYINQVLQKPYSLPKRKKNCAVLKFIELKTSKINKIVGIDEIRKMKNVLHFELMYKEGDYVKPVQNDTNRHGYFIAWASSKRELDTIIEDVDKTLKVEYED